MRDLTLFLYCKTTTLLLLMLTLSTLSMASPQAKDAEAERIQKIQEIKSVFEKLTNTRHKNQESFQNLQDDIKEQRRKMAHISLQISSCQQELSTMLQEHKESLHQQFLLITNKEAECVAIESQMLRNYRQLLDQKEARLQEISKESESKLNKLQTAFPSHLTLLLQQEQESIEQLNEQIFALSQELSQKQTLFAKLFSAGKIKELNTKIGTLYASRTALVMEKDRKLQTALMAHNAGMLALQTARDQELATSEAELGGEIRLEQEKLEAYRKQSKQAIEEMQEKIIASEEFFTDAQNKQRATIYAHNNEITDCQFQMEKDQQQCTQLFAEQETTLAELDATLSSLITNTILPANSNESSSSIKDYSILGTYESKSKKGDHKSAGAKLFFFIDPFNASKGINFRIENGNSGNHLAFSLFPKEYALLFEDNTTMDPLSHYTDNYHQIKVSAKTDKKSIRTVTIEIGKENPTKEVQSYQFFIDTSVSPKSLQKVVYKPQGGHSLTFTNLQKTRAGAALISDSAPLCPLYLTDEERILQVLAGKKMMSDIAKVDPKLSDYIYRAYKSLLLPNSLPY
ncbi:MAG: hypothetical protein HQK50_18235 [Oligoflexia bacterium]|nr:hypothetical protein [Oligoflexia bacterium]MBF0367519.1 hypothetical protein [Oligoflexia bacterium]